MMHGHEKSDPLTGCGFPTLPGWRARPIRRRPRNCRVEAMILSRNSEFYRSAGARSYGAIYAVTIRHRMPRLEHPHREPSHMASRSGNPIAWQYRTFYILK